MGIMETPIIYLSPQQYEAAELICRGFSNAGIGDKLNINIGAVAALVSKIYLKAGLGRGKDPLLDKRVLFSARFWAGKVRPRPLVAPEAAPLPASYFHPISRGRGGGRPPKRPWQSDDR